jgi:DNA-binding GntR family transcriptional regulator
MDIQTMATRQQAAGRTGPLESLSERACQSIRDQILRGRYPLGAALSRRQLAKELRMSFVPISEALQRLEMDGLVESRPRVGTRVRVPTPQSIRERYGLREALETQAARLCVENAGESGREELRKLGSQLDRLYSMTVGADEDFLYSARTCHMQFHLRVAEIGGNTLLRHAIEREQVLVFNWLFDTAAEQRTLPAMFHTELAGVLTGHSTEEADRAMRSHIRYGMEHVIEALRPVADGSGWRVSRGARGRGSRSGK